MKFSDEDVPSIYKDEMRRKINPAFVKWYQGKMVPRGPLPQWRPQTTSI